IASPDRRRSIGQAAYEEVRRSHTTTVLAPLLHKALADVTSRKIARRKLKINWLAAPSGAGRREEEERRLARELASRGHQVRLFGAEPARKGADGAIDVHRMPDGPLPPA